MSSIRYRKDIDGLRAIAVIFVIIFHSYDNLLPAGFIGVDIFFVISGFLIASIIKKSLSNNDFSFKAFYISRLWRLQPALIVIMLFVLIISAIFYLPDDFIDITNSEKYTSLLLSNQYFSRVTISYAAQDSAFLPLLHTWSLAIEWQWYLVMPVALLLLYKLNKNRRLNDFYVIITVTTLAIALSLLLAYIYPNNNYYSFSSRVFEFMIGVTVTYIPAKENVRYSKVNILAFISIFLIFFIAFKKDVFLGYPNFYTIIVCLCSAIIIYTGNYTNIVSKLLSAKILVLVGLMSYSIYLWHWPIFSVARYLGYFNNNVIKLSFIFITFVLAYLSYAYIEKPFRKTKVGFKKTILVLFITPIIITVSLNKIAMIYDGFDFRLGSNFVEMNKALKDYIYDNRRWCLNVKENTPESTCHLGQVGAKKTAFLFGDSNSNHFWGFMDILGKDADMDIYAQATSSCLTLPGIYLYDWWTYKNTVYQKCFDDTQKYFERIKSRKYDYVIIGEVWDNYAQNHIINALGDSRTINESRLRTEKALREAINIIIKSGATPVIIKTINPMPHNFITCFYQNVKLRKNHQDNHCNPHPFEENNNEWFSQLFKQLEKDYPSLIVIDPKNVQCSNESCLTDIEGIPVYRDVGHLTDYASTIFGIKYLNKYGNPFK